MKPQIIIPLRRSNNTTSTLDILEKGIYNEKKVFNKLLEDVPDIIKPKMKEMIITRNNIKYRLKGQCDAMNDDFVFEIKTKVTVNIQAYPTENAIYQLELYLRLFEKERGFIIESKDDDIKTTCRYRDDILFHFILDKLEALYFKAISKPIASSRPEDFLTDLMIEKLKLEIASQKDGIIVELFENDLKSNVRKSLMSYYKPIVQEKIDDYIVKEMSKTS